MKLKKLLFHSGAKELHVIWLLREVEGRILRVKEKASCTEKEWGSRDRTRTECEEGMDSGVDIQDLRSYFNTTSLHSAYENWFNLVLWFEKLINLYRYYQIYTVEWKSK